LFQRYSIPLFLSTNSAPTDSYNLPERFATVDVTTGSSVFSTLLFHQLIPPRDVLAPDRQYQRTTTTTTTTNSQPLQQLIIERLMLRCWTASKVSSREEEIVTWTSYYQVLLVTWPFANMKPRSVTGWETLGFLYLYNPAGHLRCLLGVAFW